MCGKYAQNAMGYQASLLLRAVADFIIATAQTFSLRIVAGLLAVCAILLVPSFTHAGLIIAFDFPSAEPAPFSQVVLPFDCGPSSSSLSDFREEQPVSATPDSIPAPAQAPDPSPSNDELSALDSAAAGGIAAPPEVQTSTGSLGLLAGGPVLAPLTVVGRVRSRAIAFPSSPSPDQPLDPPRLLA